MPSCWARRVSCWRGSGPTRVKAARTIVTGIANAFAVAGLSLLLILAVFTLLDGLLRAVANTPIDLVREIGDMIAAICGACCLPIVLLQRSNIVLRLFDRILPSSGVRVIDTLAALVIEIVMIGMAWQFWLFGIKTMRVGGIVTLFVLVAVHVPLAFAMIVVGIVAFALQTDWSSALTFLATEPSQVLGSTDLAAVPLFLMMGAFVNVSGFSRDLYAAAAALLGHRRGGLSYATIGGSAAFGAICGSSPATVATFTRVSLPEMLQRNYSPSFSGATIAAGGALKALIPPSLSMILYCVVARTYIFDVFIAAVIPALITIAANLIAIALVVRWNTGIAPMSERVSGKERLFAVRRAAPAVLLIGIIFAGLY